TSTVGGTNYYLQEIRNVAKTKDDVTRLWPHCPPEKIKILCLDLGKALFVAVSAFLPDTDHPINDKKGKERVTMTSAFPTTMTHRITAASSTDPLYPETYYNISVNQKAVYQPTFKFRRWTEEQKRVVLPCNSPKWVNRYD
ncbi:hypothetical protein BGX26_006588, partial [Mortierella sp. AD094]